MTFSSSGPQKIDLLISKKKKRENVFSLSSSVTFLLQNPKMI